MYQKFNDILDKMSKIASRDMLVYIAIGLLGLLVVYEIVMTIVIAKMRRKRICMCNIVQANTVRRWAVCTVAWLYTFFAIWNLVHIYASWIGDNQVYGLPLAFLLIFYIIEFFFTAINRTHCNCTHAHFESPKEHKQPEPTLAPIETPEVEEKEEDTKPSKKVKKKKK